jgi:hypothetical protein
MMRIVLPSKNFSCPKAGEISDPQKVAIQKKQVAGDMVSFLIVNASPESRITILVGLLRVNKCGVLRGVERFLLQFSEATMIARGRRSFLLKRTSSPP